jgi:hypothetical protein
MTDAPFTAFEKAHDFALALAMGLNFGIRVVKAAGNCPIATVSLDSSTLQSALIGCCDIYSIRVSRGTSGDHLWIGDMTLCLTTAEADAVQAFMARHCSPSRGRL